MPQEHGSRRADFHRLPTHNQDAIWRRRGYITGRITQLVLAFILGVLAHAYFS
jgi:hypothetical protein